MRIITRFFVLILCGIIPISPTIQAQDITVTGSWDLTINASDLQSGAGSDLNPTYKSENNQIRIHIRNTNTSWVVSVRGQVTNWHPDLQFYVRRTTDGGGPGSISGGTSWLRVTTIDQQFFTGSRQRANIHVRCGLTGVSVKIPPDTYSGTVIYTVTEI